MTQVPPPVRIGGLIAAAPLWLAGLIGMLLTIIDVVVRNLFNRPLSFEIREVLQEVFGWLLVIAMFGGLVLAAHGILTPAGPGSSRQRTPLAIWPGMIVSALVLLIALVLLSVGYPQVLPRSFELLRLTFEPAFFDYSSLAPPLLLAAAAAVSGGRPAGATAALAGPAVVATLWSVFTEVSIVKVMIGAAPFLIPVVIALVIAGAVTGRTSLFWPAAGAGLVPVMGLLLSHGLFTATELIGLLALVAIGAGLAINLSIRGRSALELFAVAAAEFGAIALALVAAALLSRYLAISLIGQRFALTLSGLPPAALMIGLGLVILLVSYAIGPVIGICVAFVMFPAVRAVGIDPHLLPTMAVLASIAAMLTRSAIYSGDPWRSGDGLAYPPAGALIGAGVSVLMMFLAIGFWPVIARLLERLF